MAGKFDEIVVDVEIARTIEQVGGWDHTEKMGVACAVVYSHRDDAYAVYGANDVEALQERLLAADRITTYNGWRFDFPVIWGRPARERIEALREKSNDLLGRIWAAQGLDPETFNPKTHGVWKLDNVAKATLGRGKIGNGADAPRWYQMGEWPRLVSYCIDDVKLERDLGRFIDTYGFVLCATPEGTRHLVVPR